MKESMEKKKKTLLEIISNYSKDAGYKVNMPKLINLLHTTNEQVEFGMKNKVSSTTATPQNEILGYKPKRICTSSI